MDRHVPIGELVDVVENWNPTSRPEDEFLYIDLSAVSQNEKRVVSPGRVLGAKAPSRARQLVRQGDILVSKVRPNLNGVAAVTSEFDGATASTGFCVLRPKAAKLATEYLMHWVQSPKFIDNMVREATGASYPAVSDRIVKSSLIPLPPLDEQRRIAAILDNADALRRKRKRALELLDGLTQSVFLEIFGDPAKPVSHGSKLLGETLIDIGSGWSPICLDRPATDGEPGILKLGAITAGSFLQDQNKALPQNLRPKPEAEIRDGDILFCRKNTKELVGSSVYVWETRPILYMSDLVFRLVPNPEVIDPIFLQTQLSLPSQRRSISDLAGGAAGSMPNISKARLRNLTVLVPELGAQKRFAHIAHQSRAMWSAQLRGAADANMLFSSLQHRAFAGELL